MEENADQAVQSPATPSEWPDIWLKAVTRPKLETYQDISRRADIRDAYAWLIITYLFSGGMVIIIVGLLMTDRVFDPNNSSLIADATALFFLLGFPCSILHNSIAGIAIVSGIAALSNATAKAFGGTGNFQRLIYCAAAHFVFRWIVLSLFWAALSLLDLLTQLSGLGILFGLISLVLTIYGVVLNVVAIKAVHQLGSVDILA